MRPSPPLSTPEQEFPYGWRFVKRTRPDGGEELDQIALTLEDVLHPQEGDVIPGNLTHDADCTYLATVFRSRRFGPPVVLVTHDILIDWGVEGIRHHSPDVAVFVGLDRDPPPRSGLIGVRDLRGRCELVVEVVSPSTRDNDVVSKVEHYFRVGIPLYFIIDQPTENGPRSLIPFQRAKTGYVRMPFDDNGCVEIPLLGLKIGMRDSRAVCFDRRTGRELGDYTGTVNRLEELERHNEQQQQVIEEQNHEIETQIRARQDAERETRDLQKLAAHLQKEREESERKTALAQKARESAELEIVNAQKEREEADRKAAADRKEREEADRRAAIALKEREEAERLAAADRKEREAAERKSADAQRLAEERERRILELEARLRNLETGGADSTTPVT